MTDRPAPSSHVRLLPYGDRGVLVEVDGPADVVAATSALRDASLPGIVDLVPGARTVLVVVDPRRADVRTVREALTPVLARVDQRTRTAPTGASDTPVVLDVVYDGADLARLAEHGACTVDEVVRRHVAPTYRVAFCGFAPGFAYCTGLDASLVVPRLSTPRPRVPAGSVAVAAGWCGVYPREMPGGWWLLGRTDAVLFDLGRPEPALLPPGTAVRFRAVAA